MMPVDTSNIQVTLDSETGGLLAIIAEKEQRSIPSAAAALIREALELKEEFELATLSNARLADDDGTRISHDNAWN